MSKKMLSLAYMNNGTIPPSYGEGVVYKFKSENNKECQLWQCKKESDGQWNDDGEAYLHEYERYYVLSYFPTYKTQQNYADEHMNEDWFDYDEFLINMARNGDKISAVPIFIESAAYKLPYQQFYLEKGHIYAYDQESGITRELVRIEVKDKSTKDLMFAFFTLSRSENWTVPMVANLLDSQDCKMPMKWRENWVPSMRDNFPNIMVECQDVFVLDMEDCYE